MSEAHEAKGHVRILVVEDQMLIALAIEDILLDLGCTVIGPVGKLESATQLARTEQLDAAFLDVQLDGQQVFPVAEVLEERHIPFVFVTGTSEMSLPEKWRRWRRVAKPFVSSDIEHLVRDFSNPLAPDGLERLNS